MITNKLSEILGRKRMTMAELSRKTDIGYSTIQRLYYDRLQSVEIAVLDRLCIALDCSPNDIFSFSK